MPVAAVGAAALAGALALSVGSAAVGDGIVRFGMSLRRNPRRGADGIERRDGSQPTPSTRAGMPFGGEVLVPGAPFQPENGYLGMWNWEKQVKPVPKDQTPEAQKALRAAFDAERKKFDVEAQQQGFKSAEARGRRLSFYEASPASPPSYAGPRHRREGENPRREGGGESREGSS